MNSPQKNIIWIFGDQHRSQALGIHGAPNLSPPNIDDLARSGVDFPQARGGYPLCCPARGSILTGLYPHECVAGHEFPLPEHCENRTIASALKEHGYETAWFGKWHLDGFAEAQGRAAFHTVPPHRRGCFDTWIAYENNNAQYDSWVHGHQSDGAEIPHYKLPGYETDALTDILIEFLKKKSQELPRHESKPFFASLSVQPPHDPYIAPECFAENHHPASIKLRPNVPPIESIITRARKDLAGYYGMIENLDWNVGRIRQVLQQTGLEESTYILFFSDHGDIHGSHGQFRKTSPLEEALRVPFIIGGGGQFSGHQQGVSQALVNHVDISPTTLGLCGVEKADWMRGCDFSGYYRDDRPSPIAPDSVFLQSIHPTCHEDSVNRPWRGIVSDDGWKLICLEGQPWLMHNLRDDPYEMVNLAFDQHGPSREFHHQKQLFLLQRLKKWLDDTGDVFQLPTC